MQLLRPALIALGLTLGGVVAHAQTAVPVTAPCRDGTNFSGASRRGACAGHGGVQAYGAAATTTSSAPPINSTASTAAPAATLPSTPQNRAPQTEAMTPGGGPGQVWVKSASKVYHCQGDRYYGHTKRGSYMTESAAKAAGDRPDHGKACS